MFPLNNINTALGNFVTFSETSFSFRVTPAIMVIGVMFAVFLGASADLPRPNGCKKGNLERPARNIETRIWIRNSKVYASIATSARKPGALRMGDRWIIAGVLLFVLLGAARYVYATLNAATEVDIVRVAAASPSGSKGGDVILNATGYIVAAHKIQVASKVLGRVAWIGVDKGDKVREGQVIVRPEDEEYKAQLQQARGRQQALEARLKELETGSRPEEVERSRAELAEALANVDNAKVNLDRNQRLAAEGVVARQTLDDAKARYDREVAHMNQIEKSLESCASGRGKNKSMPFAANSWKRGGRLPSSRTSSTTPSSELP